MQDKNYMGRLFDFLNKLAINNNREWFHHNKGEFDANPFFEGIVGERNV